MCEIFQKNVVLPIKNLRFSLFNNLYFVTLQRFLSIYKQNYKHKRIKMNVPNKTNIIAIQISPQS